MSRYSFSPVNRFSGTLSASLQTVILGKSAGLSEVNSIKEVGMLDRIFNKIKHKWNNSREAGVIIECPQNGLFHNLVTVILMSRTAVSQMVDHDHEHPLLVH